MQRQRGFTAIDLLVAVVIFGTAIMAGGLIAQRTMSAATTVEMQRTQYALGSSQVDKMVADAPTARSVFVPVNDVLGNSNADGHEVDFETKVTRSTGQQVAFWAYRFDSASNSLQRYSYSAPGQTATAMGNPVALGSGSSMVASLKSVASLSDALFSGLTLKSVQIPSGYSSGGQTIYEGNGVIHVTLTTAQGTYDADLVAGASPSGFTVVASTYTPTPIPSTPTPVPTATPVPGFKTWPAQLFLGGNGASVGTTNGTLASVTPSMWVARALNGLLGGGVASAAGGAACYALAQTTTSGVDNTLDSYPAVESALGVYVDSSGCEVNASDVPLTTPVIVLYEPGSDAQQFRIGPTNTCATSGNTSVGSWNPGSAYGSSVTLSTAGTSGGTCTITFSNGVSTQTLASDNGSVNVATIPPVNGTCSGTCKTTTVNGSTQTLITAGTVGCSPNMQTKRNNYTNKTVTTYWSPDGGTTWDFYKSVATSYYQNSGDAGCPPSGGGTMYSVGSTTTTRWYDGTTTTV